MKQQTDRAEKLHQTTLQQQTDLYQAKSQCDSLDRQLRESNKKALETEDSLEQTTSKLRKSEFELRSETEKLYLCKQKEQELTKEIDQLK